MKHPTLVALLVGLAAPALSAQIDVKVKTLNNAGVTLVRSDGSQVVKAFPANHTFSRYESVYYYQSNPYAYLGTTVSPPYSYGNYRLDRFGVSTRMYSRKGAGHKSLHTTGSASGAPGTQRFQVTLTSKTPAKVILDGWVYGYVYDNSTVTMKMTGGSINKTWSWNQPGYNRSQEVIKATVNGTLTLNVEVTGKVNPGAGNGYYDGFYGSLYFYVREDRQGSFKLFGKGCGNAVLGSKGQPQKGGWFTVTLDKAPAGAPVAFLFGRSKDWLHFLKLPLDLSYMGANGCALNVGFTYPINRKADAAGHAEYRLYLSRYYSGTYYVQWVVADLKANAAGITLTRGGEIKY